MKRPCLIDLFSGCGGFGLGGELAGFHSEIAIDIEPVLQSAYKRNFPKTRVIEGDLSTMDEDTWKLLLADKEIDGVIGGPPCQGYSRQGHSDPADERRTLTHHYFRTINIINPKFFIMENVEGLLDKKNRYELDNALLTLNKKYKVLDPFIVDASQYGAPTKRKRVVVIGYDPQRIAPISKDDFSAPNLKVNVHDAISDLPDPITQNKDTDDYGWAKYARNTGLSEYAKLMRQLPAEHMGWEPAKAKLKKKITSGHFDTVHSKVVAERYLNTPNGKVDKISKSKKLSWKGLSPTLRAGTGSDKGSYQAVRPLHPDHGRVITVREGARLQGFPDWFCFHHTKWHSFRMIGNSVSPIVSKAILETIKMKLDQKLLKTVNQK